MTVNVIDYTGKPREIDIGDLKNINTITMKVFSGDEIMTVYYKNGDVDVLDSSDNRLIDYFDGDYVVYGRGVNLLEDEQWMNSRDSYERMR